MSKWTGLKFVGFLKKKNFDRSTSRRRKERGKNLAEKGWFAKKRLGDKWTGLFSSKWTGLSIIMMVLKPWVGSFLDMAHLQQLKKAKISILHDFRAVPAFCDVSTWSERPLDFAGNLNRAIFVRSGWFLHRWKALFKVDEECHTFRPLERTFQHRKSSLKFKFSLVNVTIDPFLKKKWKFCL